MDEPVKSPAWDAKPGPSVYPFADFGEPERGKFRLEITAGPRLCRKAPVFTGEIE